MDELPTTLEVESFYAKLLKLEGKKQVHSNLIHNAFTEQKQLLALGNIGNEDTFQPAKAFIERQAEAKMNRDHFLD